MHSGRSDDQRLRILHVEVGGDYGGSMRALELYLAYSAAKRFEHSVLFYYPSPGCARLQELVASVDILYDVPPSKPKGKQPARRLAASALRRAGVFDAMSGLRECSRMITRLPTLWRLHRFIREGRYDVIHVNNTFPYQPLTLLAARLAGVPVVGHVRNPVSKDIVSKGLMRLCRSVATVSKSYERELSAWGLPPIVATCRDGVHLKDPCQEASRTLRRTLAPDGVLIGSAGRLDEQKGFDILIRAAKIVLTRNPDVQFVIAGEGPLAHTLAALICSLGLSGKVHLCGFRRDIENFISALDMFVSSSNWEGLPLVLLEALLMGKPVVATSVGGSAEVVSPGITGELVTKGDPDALAKAILLVIQNRNRIAHNVEQAAPHLSELIDPVRTARAFDDLLIQTWDGGHAGRPVSGY